MATATYQNRNWIPIDHVFYDHEAAAAIDVSTATSLSLIVKDPNGVKTTIALVPPSSYFVTNGVNGHVRVVYKTITLPGFWDVQFRAVLPGGSEPLNSPVGRITVAVNADD
jgi:hypothetical protein